MTAVPLPPAHLLTVGEYAALGEDDSGRSELMEGNLVLSPSPSPDHNMAALRIALQLLPQLPQESRGHHRCGHRSRARSGRPARLLPAT